MSAGSQVGRQLDRSILLRFCTQLQIRHNAKGRSGSRRAAAAQYTLFNVRRRGDIFPILQIALEWLVPCRQASCTYRHAGTTPTAARRGGGGHQHPATGLTGPAG